MFPYLILKVLLVKYGVRDLSGPQPPQAPLALIMITPHLCPTTPIPLFRAEHMPPHIWNLCHNSLSEPRPLLMPHVLGYL